MLPALCPEAYIVYQFNNIAPHIDTEGSLADMVGGYTALEGRWSRGRQVQIL